jgi:ubiquinol-cytochrome c reductase iron-sulfur subunit
LTTFNRRLLLLRATKYFLGLLGLVLLFVFVDFAVDFRPSRVHASYRFTLSQIPLDQPIWLRQDNLTVLLIRRSKPLIEDLKNPRKDLQDADSDSSHQPDYAKNSLRSRNEQYFVAYGLGTDLGCPLSASIGFTLRESCSDARYDYAGRAIVGKNQFLNLAIPDYNFSRDFSVLTITL